MAASSSRGRSSSPFSNRKPSTPYSSTSSSSSMMNGRLMPRSCSSSATSFYGVGGSGGYGSRSMASNRSGGDFSRSRTPVAYPSMGDQLIGEPAESASRSGDSIAVTIRFRPLRWIEFDDRSDFDWFIIFWFGARFKVRVRNLRKLCHLHCSTVLIQWKGISERRWDRMVYRWWEDGAQWVQSNDGICVW